MSRTGGFRQPVSLFVIRLLASLMLVASLPTLVSAVVFLIQGGSRSLFAGSVAGIAGAGFLGMGVLGLRAPRPNAAKPKPPEQPSEDESGDLRTGGANWLRWPLAVVFAALAALLIVPAAIEQIRWRLSFGLLEMPSELPPGLHWCLLQLVGVALLMIVAGLVFQKERLIGWGGALIVIVSVGALLGSMVFVLIPI